MLAVISYRVFVQRIGLDSVKWLVYGNTLKNFVGERITKMGR
jgi:hypothetical protein